MGQGDSALEACRESLVVARELVAHLPDSLRALTELSGSLQTMGDFYTQDMRLKDALVTYQESLNVQKQILAMSARDSMVALGGLYSAYLKCWRAHVQTASVQESQSREEFIAFLEDPLHAPLLENEIFVKTLKLLKSYGQTTSK